MFRAICFLVIRAFWAGEFAVLNLAVLAPGDLQEKAAFGSSPSSWKEGRLFDGSYQECNGLRPAEGATILGVDSPFFSTIVLFNHRSFQNQLFCGVLLVSEKKFGSLETMVGRKRGSLERMEMGVSPRTMAGAVKTEGASTCNMGTVQATAWSNNTRQKTIDSGFGDWPVAPLQNGQFVFLCLTRFPFTAGVFPCKANLQKLGTEAKAKEPIFSSGVPSGEGPCARGGHTATPGPRALEASPHSDVKRGNHLD